MKKRMKLASAVVLDPESVNVNLICVEDETAETFTRSIEVIDVATKVICLASKRGRVKQELEVRDEEVNEKAA